MSDEGKIVHFVRGTQYLSLPRDPYTWIVQGIVPTGGTVNLFGAPKSGKSLSALQLAHAVSNPTVDNWLGFNINQHGRVAYIQVDTPRELWMTYMDNYNSQGYNFSETWITDIPLLPRYPFNILDPIDYTALSQGVRANNPLVVIIDTLREVHEEDEDKATPMKKVIAQLFAATRPAALVVLSHARKGNPEYGDNVINDQRGSIYVAGRMDMVIKQTEKALIFKGRSDVKGKYNISLMTDTSSGKKKYWIERGLRDEDVKVITKAMKLKGSDDERTLKVMEELQLTKLEAESRIKLWVEMRKKEEAEDND